MARLKPEERQDWIIAYLRETAANGPVDVLNRDFVDAYIAATGATFREVMFGAYKCAQLGRDLSTMVEDRKLKRSRTGIQGFAGMGFPRWVWSYRLPYSKF